VQDWVLTGIGPQPSATPNAITLATQAERAFLAGNVEEAVNGYAQSARLAPQNIDILFEYGRMLIYRSYAGRSLRYHAEEALQVAEQAVQTAPENPRAQALLCMAFVANDRAEEAIQAGLRAVDLSPDYAEAHAYLAMAYQSAGRPNQALAEAEQAVQLNPDSLDARRALALGLAFIGNADGAIQQYERALQIHPRFDALYFELAMYYNTKENYEAAIMAYDKILAMEPDNVKAYTRKCEMYYKMREDALAQESCEQAIQLDPAYPEAHRQLGMVRYARRNYEGAIDEFVECNRLQAEQGVPLNEQEIQCWYLQGLAYSMLAQCDQAWPILQQALQMNPDERIKGFISEGLMSCVNYGDYSLSDIPTPIPNTPIPAEPIGIY
jgi:tetratricopeptide (TPR) repeat protein